MTKKKKRASRELVPAKRGRPVEGNPKNRMFTMRLSDEMNELIDAIRKAGEGSVGIPISKTWIIQKAMYYGLDILVQEDFDLTLRNIKRKMAKKAA
jgi:hypothetical protein